MSFTVSIIRAAGRQRTNWGLYTASSSPGTCAFELRRGTRRTLPWKGLAGEDVRWAQLEWVDSAQEDVCITHTRSQVSLLRLLCGMSFLQTRTHTDIFRCILIHFLAPFLAVSSTYGCHFCHLSRLSPRTSSLAERFERFNWKCFSRDVF